MKRLLVYNEEYGDDFSALDHDEYIVGEALLIKKELSLSEVQQLLDSSHVYPVINRLINKKVCFVWEALKQTYSPKKETYVLLNPEYDNEEKLSELLNNWTKAPKQMELLLSYLHLVKTEGEVTKTDLLKKSGASDAQLKGLVEKKILRTEKRIIDRMQYLPKNVKIDFELTAVQQKAFEQVKEQLQSKTGLFAAWCYFQWQNKYLYQTDRRIYQTGKTGIVHAAGDCTYLADHPTSAKTFWRVYRHLSFQIFAK